MKTERSRVRAVLDELSELAPGVPLFELKPWCESCVDVLVHHRAAANTADDIPLAGAFEANRVTSAVVEVRALCQYLPAESSDDPSCARSVIISVLQQFADTLLYAVNVSMNLQRINEYLSAGARLWRRVHRESPDCSMEKAGLIA
jgi:hypothetical protein